MPKRGPLRGVPAKRKRVDSASSKGGRGKPPATAAKSAPFALKWDEDVESGDESADDMVQKKPKRPLDEDEDEDDEEMDPEEHRKRLAYQYLQSMKEDSDHSDDESTDSAELTERLRRERLESQGMYFRDLSSKINDMSLSSVERTVLGGHELPVTCVALAADDRTVFSGSKDNSVVRWDLEAGGASKTVLHPKWSRKTHPDIQAGSGEVLAMAVTSDGKYLASGGRDCLVRIFDLRSNQEIKAFSGHRDAVTSMAFRRDSNSLFTGSLDRCVKHWDLNEMGYLETAFGHQEGINGMDCWNKARPASVSADKTLRHWKITEDSHLVFRGHKSSIDVVQILTADSILSGGADGSLCLWKETQKKPVVTVRASHGFEGDDNSAAMRSENPRWLSSLTCVKMSNLAASGSSDGYVKLWHASADDHELFEVGQLPCGGFVNGLAMSSRLLVAGTGTEHRLGRWWKLKGPLNKVVVYKLPDLGDELTARKAGSYGGEDSDSAEDEDAYSNASGSGGSGEEDSS